MPRWELEDLLDGSDSKNWYINTFFIIAHLFLNMYLKYTQQLLKIMYGIIRCLNFLVHICIVTCFLVSQRNVSDKDKTRGSTVKQYLLMLIFAENIYASSLCCALCWEFLFLFRFASHKIKNKILNFILQVNSSLEQLVETVGQLSEIYELPVEGKREDSIPMFLSQLSLDEYYKKEDKFSQELSLFTKKKVFEVHSLYSW